MTADTFPESPGARHALVRAAAAIAGGSEEQVRTALRVCAHECDHQEVEELILQSYLFAGFPRAINSARAWRSISRVHAPSADAHASAAVTSTWRSQGEETCARVYGDFYPALRANMRALHPALDEWMIVEGYGKVLSRPQLDLKTRELCIVAACAASGQQRQLHSHMHGALNVGATVDELSATITAVSEFVVSSELPRIESLLQHVARSRAGA